MQEVNLTADLDGNFGEQLFFLGDNAYTFSNTMLISYSSTQHDADYHRD